VNRFWTALTASWMALGLPVNAYAQDDDLADILNDGSQSSETTIADERRAVESDTAASTQELTLAPPKKRVIKILQRKQFMKINRAEITPMFGGVVNDPFLRRIIFGADITYYPTEVLGVELSGGFSPNLGEADWKGITKQIVEENKLSPELSRLMGWTTLSAVFSPIHGKVAVVGKSVIIFDIYGTFGAGLAFTHDDEQALSPDGGGLGPAAQATLKEFHPTISFGGGFRAAFNETVALRFEVRSLSYIEVIEATNLQLKNNVMLKAGVSFFFPRAK